MHNQNKSKKELLSELLELQEKYESLKISKAIVEEDFFLAKKELSYENNENEKSLNKPKLSKLTQDKIETSEKRYQTLFDNIWDAIMVADTNRNVIDCNQAFCSVFGYHHEEIIGKQTVVVYEKEEEFNELGKALKEHYGDRPFLKTVNYKKKSGEVFTGETRVYYLKDTKGTVTGFIGLIRDISERKQAIEALHLSEERFRTLFEKASLPAALTQLPGHEFVDVNDAWLKIFEYSKEEVIGKTSLEIGINRDVKKRTQIISKIKDKGHTSNFEQQLFSKTGKQLSLLSNVNIVEIDGEDFAITSMQDITESKKIELAIKESDELLRLSSELANVAAWEMDLVKDSMTRTSNHDSLYGLTGVGQWHVNTFMDAVHLDDREKCNSFINQSLAPGGPDKYKFDFRILYPDKSIHWLNVIGEVIERDADGVGIKIRGFINDITERKQAEQKLKESEEKFRGAVMESPFPIMIHSENGKIVLINETWHEITGYSHQEIPTIEKWTKLAYGEKMKVVKKDINALYKLSKRMDEGEYEICTKNKEKRIWAFSSAPIGRDSEKNRLVISMALDVTERNKAVNTLRTQETFISGMLGSITDGIMHLDNNWCYTYVNDEFVSRTGKHSVELLGHCIWDLYPELVGTEVYHNFLRAMSERVPIDYEYYFPNFQKWYASKVYPTADGGLMIYSKDINDKKIAEAAMKQSEEKFSTTFYASPVAMSITRMSDGLIIDVNKNYLKMFEFKLEDVINHTSLELNIVRLEDRTKIIKIVKEKGEANNVELLVNGKSGKKINLLLSTKPITINNEACILSTMIDITDSKETEMALKLSEETFSNAFHSGPAGLTITRIADGKFIDVNDSFLRMFEFNREEVIGHTSIETNMLSPEERAKLIKMQLETGGLKNCELVSKTKSGKMINMLFSSRPILINDESCHVTTLIDITDRKLVEKELKKHQEHLEELVKERTKEIETKNITLEKMNKLFVGRELRMKELKEEIEKLKNQSEA